MNAPAPARASRAWLRALETTARGTRDLHRTLPRAVEAWAQRSGEAPALIGESVSLSYAGLAGRMNLYSRWALSLGLEKGDAVALRLGNCPDYFACWLGLTQIGVVVALFSPDWRAPALAHALAVSQAKLLIGADADEIGADVEVWRHGDDSAAPRALERSLQALSGAPLDEGERREVTLDDRALRIFTSGTTGLPKAAEVSHRRLVTWTHWFAGLANLGPAHRHYNCLPMHHSVGGVVAIGAPLVNGGSVVIAPKFSARGFWRDVARHDCTSFQYIGELCRYLVAAPASEEERGHRLRLALGNGLSGDVWRQCLERFGPLEIVEFYASTEGNVWLYNCEGRIGSIGRLPPSLAASDPLALARFDAATQAPLRGPDGFCLRCADGETGEALGRIGAGNARFEGYSQAGESERKILRDVFKPGDAWMRTGDLLRRDADGFYVFVDRIGDTFRWKGENVATLEVVRACLAAPGVEDALVFGVRVPGAEGRAGMALLKLSGALDLEGFAAAMQALPAYARPFFLRVTHEIATTETHKPKRGLYLEQGYDVARVADPLFVWDAGAGGYVRLDEARHAAIARGEVRL